MKNEKIHNIETELLRNMKNANLYNKKYNISNLLKLKFLTILTLGILLFILPFLYFLIKPVITNFIFVFSDLFILIALLMICYSARKSEKKRNKLDEFISSNSSQHT